jgi:hypothetical protein
VNQAQVIKAIEAERTVQDALWGGKGHDSQHPPKEWLALFEERLNKLGPVVDALASSPAVEPDPAMLALWRRHLIELAALAMAALEVS